MTESNLAVTTAHQKRLATRRAEFTDQLAKTPPQPCNLRVGQRVTYTNEYGVVFPSHTIVGFADTDSFYGRFVHLDTDCYWMPVHPHSVRPE